MNSGSASQGYYMANEEHVALLKQGWEVWNVWREDNPDVRPDLGEADLGGADLDWADLYWADLYWADLRGASLVRANLSEAILNRADLRGADLNRADLSKARLNDADLGEADLGGADLGGAFLREANLSRAFLGGGNLGGAKLTRAVLSKANLTGADLTEADLTGVDLGEADLGGANLTGADLTEADLTEASVIRANLTGANLTRAVLGETVFGKTNLSDVKGVDSCMHAGPSIIDHRTLQCSGQWPLAFLRGVGLPENLIDYLPSLLNQPIQFFSCFISYSSKDQKFADRLHADLQNKGVRCWFAPHDMPIGAKIIDAIDEAIRLRDKVLLILSENSVASDWVEGEVTRSLDEERERKQVVLFPVRIDDTVLTTNKPWTRLLRGQRNIGNFTCWKDHDAYQKVLERLLHDLKVEQSGTS
jgi:uncharacterized protein YjbI with pentapeptide repeats